MTRVLLIALIIAFAGPAKAQSVFDGLWSVDVNLGRGDCPDRASFPVRIAAGQIVYAGNLDIDAAGTVGSDGRVSGQVRRGRDFLIASGRLSARSGAGQWRSPSRACAGTWRARRISS